MRRKLSCCRSKSSIQICLPYPRTIWRFLKGFRYIHVWHPSCLGNHHDILRQMTVIRGQRPPKPGRWKLSLRRRRWGPSCTCWMSFNSQSVLVGKPRVKRIGLIFSIVDTVFLVEGHRSYIGWRPSLFGWRPSLLGWRPLLLGHRRESKGSDLHSEYLVDTVCLGVCKWLSKLNSIWDVSLFLSKSSWFIQPTFLQRIIRH